MERIQIIIVKKSPCMSGHVLLMYVICGSVARTVFVFLITRSMKYKGLRIFVWVWGVWVCRVFLGGGGGCFGYCFFSFVTPKDDRDIDSSSIFCA